MSASNPLLLEHHNQLVTAIATTVDISRGVRTVLVGIATFFNVDKQCSFPTRRQIAERTGYCVNHITHLIKEAVDAGLIKSTAQYVQKEGEEAPRQIQNKYEFVLSKFNLYYSKLSASKKRKDRNKQAAQTHWNELNSSLTAHTDRLISEAIHQDATQCDFDSINEYLESAPPPK